MLHFADSVKILNIISSSAYSTGLTASDYFFLGNSDRCYLLLRGNFQSTAQPTISFLQAKSATGDSSKATTGASLSWWSCSSTATDTLCATSSGPTYACEFTTGNTALVVAQIEPTQFDTNNEFDWLSVSLGATGDASNTVDAYILATDLRQHCESSGLPSLLS